MVRNLASREEFEAGDEILFSIRAVPQANFDGGEIIRLPAGGAASFLSHGGHDWDSAFATAATFESNSEDVDALEATPSPSEIPSLTGWLKGVLPALLVALALVTMRRAPAAGG
ncbi:MAG: hypothetical protein JRG80_14405 [Deltaproteobacteria bacterium]|nr:hypothetical protein [Deltaproteobacteria bacterium]